MIFKKLKIKNIRSYEDAEIEFPKGSVLLSGDIGSGKTTLLLAIEFALFGLQPGQKGTSILRNNSNEGEIELDFEINNQKVSVGRKLKRKKSVTQENSFITINGEKEEKSVTEIKNKILNLINYPKEFSKKINLLYKFTVYTPQEEMKQIILENSETRLNTLRHVFGIDKYKRIKENSQILISKIKEISKLKQGEILDLDYLKENISEKQSYIKELKIKIRELNSNLSNSNSQILKKDKELSEIKSKIDEKNKLENEIEKINILLSTKRQRIQEITKQINEINKNIEETKNNFDQKEFDKINSDLENFLVDKNQKNNKVIELSLKIDSLTKRIVELNSLVGKISNLKKCPTCLQQVSSFHKNNLFDQTEKEIAKLTFEKNSHLSEKSSLQNKLNYLEEQIKILTDRTKFFDSLKFKIDSLKSESEKTSNLEKEKISLENDSYLLDEQIKRIKQSLFSLKKYENTYSIKEKELSELKSQNKDLEIKKAQTEKESDMTKKEINSLNEKIKQKEQIKKQVHYLTELNNWISSMFLPSITLIEKNVLSKLRHEFSRLFNQWFSTLVPDTFNVRLDEEFTPIIEQKDYQLDYSFLSGGEKTAVALAYRLALNQTINSVLSEIKTKGVVILDEPTDGFSQKQLDKMRDVLSQLEVEQLIIVSHDPKIETFVENVIKLEKQNNVSKIV